MEEAKQIVSCSGTDCGICSLLETISRLYNNFIVVSLAVAVFGLVVAGAYLILATGRERVAAKAKMAIKSLLLGFSFVLLGWLIVHAAIGAAGAKNSGSWFSFECAKEYAIVEEPIKRPEIKSFASLADFLKSGELRGLIEGGGVNENLASEIKELLGTDKLVLSAPAKMNSSVSAVDNLAAYVPFLSVSSKNGTLKIEEDTLDNLRQYQNLIESDGKEAVSLTDIKGGSLSGANKEQINSAINREIASLLGSLESSGSAANSFLSSAQQTATLEDLIFKIQNGNREEVNKVIDSMINVVAKEVGKEVEGFQAEKVVNGSFNEGVSEIQRVSGDRSELSNLIDQIKPNTSSSAENIADKISKNEGIDIWPSTGATSGSSLNSNRSTTDSSNSNKNNSQSNSNSNTNRSWVQNWNSNSNAPKKDPYANDNMSQGENFDGWKKDKENDYDNKNDNFNCNYKPDDPNIIMAMKRIECRDPLRYEMIHRFVRTIKNTDFEGGFCAGCGEINVNFDKLPLKILDQVIVHEATHSAHFCVGMSEPIAEVERIACGNQMGSLDRMNCDKHLLEKKNFMMREFERQGKEVMYKGIPVRGYLSRWQNKVSPIGDLTASAFDWPIQYALSYGDTTFGPYHYGDHEARKNLGLKNNEEGVVEKIMENRQPCFVKSMEGLPKAGECEKTGGGPIQIDYSK